MIFSLERVVDVPVRKKRIDSPKVPPKRISY
jgi:hypothetical protein